MILPDLPVSTITLFASDSLAVKVKRNAGMNENAAMNLYMLVKPWLSASAPASADPAADPAEVAVLYSPRAVPRLSKVMSDTNATEATYITPNVRPCKSCIGRIRLASPTIV